ncbi:hypothetical protein BMS3Bbin14_00425 [bacterium BMS3Bbin14]|nr:hypothetical protein BMS3Abin13_02136 [bacterium BMS3Abin13]GBE51967.1 hypothetical protein BMS3Bbin14_00425 [bacterium BMS3Bbin14]HDK43484.1 hydrogenase maturation protease [Desulfobacteraceae bacterium]HDO29549.1 hydrogenase maturation protease [Desulfobacteraceae bacterium]
MSGLVVAGIGSRYLADDGIGLRLVETLDHLEPGVRSELWEDADALTLSHRLLDLSAPVLLVDCADMGLAGGEWRCFRVRPAGDHRAGVELVLRSRTLSTHGLGLAEAVRIAMELGLGWPVHVFGVQPFELELQPRSGEELSPAMRSHLPALRSALRQRIRALSTTCVEEV